MDEATQNAVKAILARLDHIAELEEQQLKNIKTMRRDIGCIGFVIVIPFVIGVLALLAGG